jgi:O-antigen/teichoic acid export membrane protein
MFKKLSLLIGTVVLAGGVLIVFFGGTWEGARIGLEILGAIWLLQTAYSVIVENRKEKEQELKKITDKYFKDDLK